MADDFDPDAYLADASDPAPTGSSAFDPDEYIASFDPDAYLNRPKAEGMLETGVREAAHGVVPAAAGLAGMGYGAAAGAAVGGPVGAIVGGIVGGVGAGMGAGFVQEKALDALDLSDAEQRAVNKEENPWSSRLGAAVPQVAGMSVAAGASRLAPVANEVVQRGAGAVFGGAMEAGQQAISDEEMNWTDVAFQAAVGAVAPGVNKQGAKLVNAGERAYGRTPYVPGRPNQPKNEDPLAQQAHADVSDPATEVDLAGSSLAQAAPPPTGETTGNPQSAPVRSTRDYAKGTQPTPAAESGVSEGQIQPAEAAALEAANPSPEIPPAEIAPRPDAAAPVAQSAEPAPISAEPVVDAGFPKPGEPVAMGANDAAPVPATPPGAAAAINQSKKKLSLKRKNSLEEPIPVAEGDPADMPPLNSDGTPADDVPGYKGKVNTEPTEAQKEAGNYAKARANDFGKPLRLETPAGVERKGKDADGKDWAHAAPYHYGYFGETRGADRNRAGKRDAIDWAEAPEGTPERGNKHFIIDQRDLKTGKFDEHKVFRNYADIDAARYHYEAGFGDGKGAARLGAITEVDRPTMVKWLAGSKKRARTQPYGEFQQGEPETGASVETKTPKVVEKARELMQAQGLPKEALDMFDALPAARKAEEATKFVNAKNSKTGVVKSAKVARIRPQAPEIPGSGGLTARNLKEAKLKGDAIAQWNKALENNKPGENETETALRSRLQAIVKDGGNSIDVYKPSKKPAGYLMVKAAREMLARKKWKPENIDAFRAQENLLRSGDEGVTAARDTNKIDAGIARSRRSGEAAIDSAVAARQSSGRNDSEDAMIEALDAKKGGKFDVPHEEAEAMVEPTPVRSRSDLKELPKKTVDVADSSLAKIDTGKITATVNEAAARRKAEAAALAGKKADKANVASEEKPAAPAKKINITDPAEMQRIMDAMKLAESRKNRDTGEFGPREVEAAPKKKRDLVDIARDMMNDTSGSGDPGKIIKDMQRWMSGAKDAFKKGIGEKTHYQSYRTMEPKTEYEKFSQKTADDLQVLKKRVEGANFDVLLDLDKMKPADRLASIQEEIYHAREKDSAHFPLPAGKTGRHVDNMSPEATRVYKEHVEKNLDMAKAHADAIRAIDPDKIGPAIESHISRITKGDDSQFNMLKDEDDPTMPGMHHTLMTNSNFAKDRQFYVLVGPDGRRHVISLSDNGFTKWEKRKPERIKAGDFKFEDGGIFKAGPNDYVMRQATTKEIEDHALINGKPARYYKNAAFSAAMANAQLGTMWRNIKDLHDITQTEDWKKYTSTNPASQQSNGYVETKFPNMKGVYMHPSLAAVFDDFAGRPPSWYSRLNSVVTKLIFWMPTAHIRNVAEHMIVGRGWDNFNPAANWRLLTDIGPKAIKSVLQQDDYQKRLREIGAGTIYPSVKTRRMIEQVAKGIGLDIEQNPGKWGPVADKFGLTSKQLYNAVYDTSSKAMWSAGDMLLTMRIMELERKGLDLKKAVIEAERDIPNYRVPTHIGGRGEKGRLFSKLVQNPMLVAFGRYHYGMYNSYAAIFKDAFGPNATVADRMDAAGKLMTMGAIAFMVYPVVNALAQKITGNEDAKVAPRGPMAVPKHTVEGLRGEADIAAPLRGSITMSPLLQAAKTVYDNKDFRGKPLVSPGDLRQATVDGDWRGAANAVASGVDGVARSVISPWGTLSNAANRRESTEDSLLLAGVKGVRDAALDIKDPSDRMKAYKEKVDIRANRERIQRERRPGGLFEGWVRGAVAEE